MSDYSTFLFTMPSTMHGAASVVDLAGQLALYNQSSSDHAADMRALWADHAAVISDCQSALDELSRLHA